MTIKALFFDVGGVLMTNGWGHELREKIAQTFGFDYDMFSKRHTMFFELFETGKISFDEYLNRTIFNKKRDFTVEDIKRCAFEAALPFEDMLALAKNVKTKNDLKIVLVSNEGRELAVDRIERFDLKSFADCFVVSSFVGIRKPDPQIYQLAIDLVQVLPEEICYIDDRELLIECGKALGLKTIQQRSFSETKEKLIHFGLLF